MILLQEPFISDTHECPYLEEQPCRFEYFFAVDVSGNELSLLNEQGWRKFGAYFFRPNCPGCRKCVPLRIPVRDFSPSKSQRRVQRKGLGVEVRFGPLQYSDRIYEIYKDHSLSRFGKATDKEDFVSSFYTQSCPTLQSEYYVDGMLVALGFLDRGINSLSSVYFVYDTSFAHLRLGTLSVLKETEYARSIGLDYYYLGYWIRENHSMAYKSSFYPQDHYDWESGQWKRINRGDD